MMDARRTGMREALLVWAIYAITAVAIFVTYWRFPASDFYHVSLDGLELAASRTLVFSNFSTSLVAVALLGFAVVRLLGLPEVAAGYRGIITAFAIVGTLLCFVTALPGVVDQADLDWKWVNVIPAAGVLIAIGLTVAAVRAGGVGPAGARTRGDSARWVAIGVLVIFGLPWILADLGIYTGDIPGLEGIVMSKELPETGGTLRAVHLGHHHGMDGVLFAVTSLILAGGFRSLRPGRLKHALGWYVALMLPYGIGNALNDFWTEQIRKRGTTNWHLPEMLRPEPNLPWVLILLGTVVAWYLLFRPASEVSAPDTSHGTTGLGAQGGTA